MSTRPKSRRKTRENGFLHCAGPCGEYKPPSQFYGRKRETPNGTIWEFDSECKLCQQNKRVEQKYEDLARWIIEQRAESHAGRFSQTKEFMMAPWGMNYESLVAPLRGILEALNGDPKPSLCACGHKFRSESDIQIEHRSPPHDDDDYARLHARNLGWGCTSCNSGKKDMEYDDWLDSEEQKRQSAVATNHGVSVPPDFFNPPDDYGLRLF